MKKKGKSNWQKQIVEISGSQSLIEYSANAIPMLGSKSASKKAISSGRMRLNGKPAKFTDKVKRGDLLELRKDSIAKARKFDFDLEVVFEDDFLVIVNKPGGIAVNGNRNKTVENALGNINKKNTQADALPRAVAAHRIDVPTAGLVLLAKTKGALIQLGKAFQSNQIKKEYLAVVHGKTLKNGVMEDPINGKKAKTNFETIKTVHSKVFEYLSFVKLQPITGRTHQLRIHLNNKGHLIIGDKLYAENKKTILGKGLLLCASRLQFMHPITGESLDIQIKPPAKFLKILKREAAWVKK